MEEIMVFWMVLLILCIGIEVLTLGLTTIWFAAGALVAIFAALLQAPIFIQVILFLVVSLVSLFFTRPIAVKYFNKDRVKTNVESMVGRQAIVTGEIDNLQATGQVTVSGQEWSARSWDDRVKIPAGAVVVVAAISGVKLIVRMEQQFSRSSGEEQNPYEPEYAASAEERKAVKDEALVQRTEAAGSAERKAMDYAAAEQGARDGSPAERQAMNDVAAEQGAMAGSVAEQKAMDDVAAEQGDMEGSPAGRQAAEDVSAKWMDEDESEQKI